MGLIFNRHKTRPEHQYWGGSEEAYKKAQQQSEQAIGNANKHARMARQLNDEASRTSDARFRDQNNELSRYGSRQEKLANRSEIGFNTSVSDYKNARSGVINNARALEKSANNAGENYRQTSNRQFASQQDRNQRAALALGSTGGAGGLRTALASSSTANAQAANQSQVIQAQELNQIQAAKESALTNAANIRAGVAGQDSNMAGQFSERQQNALGNQLATQSQKSSNIGTQGQIASVTAGQALSAASAERDQVIGQNTDMNSAQFVADREHEIQRQRAGEKNASWFKNPFS